MKFTFIKQFGKITVLVLLVSLTACKKKEIQGPKGEPGTNGTGGNASMSSSSEFVVATTEWVNTNNVWKHNYASTLVTAKVVASGGVKVYMKVSGNWHELPFADGDILTQFGFSEGNVTLSVADIHGGLPEQPTTTSFRVLTFYDSPRPANASSNAISSLQQISEQ